MTITYAEHPTLPVVEITLNGRVTQADMDRILPKMEAFLARHPKVRFLEVIEHFDGFDISTLWDGLKFDARHLRQFSHVAVASDIGWIGPISKAAAAVMPLTLRTFPLSEVDAARAWLENPDAATA